MIVWILVATLTWCDGRPMPDVAYITTFRDEDTCRSAAQHAGPEYKWVEAKL
jgi:hypothetical protein